jgi:hypothetical protein
MDIEDGPSRLEGFALYMNSYVLGVIGLVAAFDDSLFPVLEVAAVVGMVFLPLAFVGFAVTPRAARRAWYFVRLAAALAVVLTVLSQTLPSWPRKSVEWSYVAGILGLLAVSTLIRVAAAWTGSSASGRGSSVSCQAVNRESARAGRETRGRRSRFTA